MGPYKVTQGMAAVSQVSGNLLAVTVAAEVSKIPLRIPNLSIA
jgi:hypothetical protein